MSTVAREAGLSQGIIKQHFQSIDRQLEETLRYVIDEYRDVLKHFGHCIETTT